MNYRFLGKTGMKVSELCLGAMTLGREAGEALSHQMLNRFVEAGGNFIDTADVYRRGASETVIGHWLKDKPRDTSSSQPKCTFAWATGQTTSG